MGWTYATLVQAIKDYTEYDETTFSANIDNFIQSAEERIFYAVDLEDFRKEYNPTEATGIPKYYALFDKDNFLIAPVPNAAFVAEIHYYYKPASITTGATTWLGDNAVEALLYGSLVEAYTFMKGENELLNTYNQRFIEALTRLKNYGEGRENDDAYRDGLIRVKAN